MAGDRRRRRPLFLACAGFLAAPVVIVVTMWDGSSTAVEQAPATREVREIFLRDCAVCHGSEGGGSERGPSLVGIGEAAVHYWISTGRMPLESPDAHPERSEPAYPPATVDALVDHVVEITGGGGVPTPELDLADADVARGGELYRLNCAACHSWSGVGGALVGLPPAPATSPATARQIAEAVRIGPSAMPAFGSAALTDDELDDLVAYVRYLDHPRTPGGLRLGGLGPLAEGAVAIVIGLGALLLAVRAIGTRA